MTARDRSFPVKTDSLLGFNVTIECRSCRLQFRDSDGDRELSSLGDENRLSNRNGDCDARSPWNMVWEVRLLVDRTGDGALIIGDEAPSTVWGSRPPIDGLGGKALIMIWGLRPLMDKSGEGWSLEMRDGWLPGQGKQFENGWYFGRQ